MTMAIADRTVEQLLARAIAVQQTAAPTFHESARATLVRDAFSSAGLRDVMMDEMHNVYGRLPGAGGGKSVLISAHLDTVFAADTDLSIRRSAGRISGPGIGDNSLGVAVLMELPRLLHETHVSLAGDLWLVANVCEEGRGDLRGMRAVMDRLGGLVGACVVLEGGFLGRVCFRAVGSRRYRVGIRTGGGHSWFDFGKPSAVHVLVRLAERLADLHVPRLPKTTFNIGVIEGGTSVNTIAESANLQLDLRSESPDALNELVAQVEHLRDSFAADDVTVTWETIGERPAGALPRDHPLVRYALDSLQDAGVDASEIDTTPASTDANIPLSMGRPAVCIGLAHGYNLHRRDEYIETGSLKTGLCQLLFLIQKLQGSQWAAT